MEDDDVGIPGGSRCTGQRVTVRTTMPCFDSLSVQESAIDHVFLDEKNANGVVRVVCLTEASTTDACLQGHDSSIDPSLPSFDVLR